MQLNFNCAPTLIGSLPGADPVAASGMINKYLVDLPAWPQLPRRVNLENMYIQYSEGFPGIEVDKEKIRFERAADFDSKLEQLYADSCENKTDGYPVSQEYAAGLYSFASSQKSKIPVAKGQLIGPISWGLCVTDHTGKGIIYDDTLAEAIGKFLRLKASWQEKFLGSTARQTVIFIDEPYLASLGSAFIALPNQQISHLISEVLAGISGIKGIHCCGATDWSLLLNLPIDIISFDAYNYLDSILCYQAELCSFVRKGKAISWGIIPNDEDLLKNESTATIYDRFAEALAPLTREGIPIRDLVRQSIITPTCGLASLSRDAVEHVFTLLNCVSERIRRKYSS
jgi:methionine synthase II (cobalamin-independent)